jgi:hypothetical protein
MKTTLPVLLLGLALAVAACTPAVRQGPPAPIVGPGGAGAGPATTTQKTPAGDVAVTPLEPPKVQAVSKDGAQPLGFQRVSPEVVAAGGTAPATSSPAATSATGTAEAPRVSTPPRAGTETVALATPAGTSKAVKTLLQQAELQRSSGDLTGAAATLERALRIEPENAYVWNRLAHVRLKQGQNGLAAELAAKSNAFAGADDAVRRDNDALIARAGR